MTLTNTLAYYNPEVIKVENSYIEQAPGDLCYNIFTLVNFQKFHPALMFVRMVRMDSPSESKLVCLTLSATSTQV